MVQVIPKATAKKESAIKKILPWFSFLLVILVVALYFIFNDKVIKIEAVIEKTEQELVSAQTESHLELERELSTFKMKVDEVVNLLQNRKKLSDFFSFLETFVHPNIYFTSLSLSMNELKADIGGISNNFLSLGEQILALERTSFVKEANLTNVSLDEEYGIQFFIEVILSSDKTLEKNSQ